LLFCSWAVALGVEGDVMVALLLGETSADSAPDVAGTWIFFLFFFFFFFFFFGVVSTPVVAETTPGPDAMAGRGFSV